MKKALVIALMMVLGVGALTTAATITGSWDVTFSVNFHKLYNACPYAWSEIFGMDSTLEMAYTVGGVVFSSVSTFDAAHGFNAQEFSAAGGLGAFTFEAKMEFLPNAVINKYEMWWDNDYPEADDWWWYNNFCDSALCDMTVLTRYYSCSPQTWFEETAPVFKDFEGTLGVSIAGLEIEGLALLNGWVGTTVWKDLFFWPICKDVDSPFVNDNLFAAHVEDVVADVWYFGMCPAPASDAIGAAFRLKLAGMAGGLNVTSFTYFNMTESDAAADKDSGCPVLGKKGNYAVAADDCGLTFTEEYFMVEGIAFCCDTTLDVALKLVCPAERKSYTCECTDAVVVKTQTESVTVSLPPIQILTPSFATVGFEYVQFLLKDIPFIPGFYDLTLAVKFTTTTKEFSLCGQPAFPYPTCFTITLLPNWEEDKAHNSIANKFTGIDIKDLSVTCELPGITATFKTILYDLPNNALKTIASDEVLSFLVPTGCAAYGLCPPYGIWLDQEVYKLGVFLDYWETAKYKYFAWEALTIELDGDACCGGSYDITIDNYIGKKYEADPEFCGCIGLKLDYFTDAAEAEAAQAAFTALIAGEELTEAQETLLEKYAAEEVEEHAEVEITLVETPWATCVYKKVPNYTEVGQLTQLFSWMATDVDVSISLFSNFTLTLGAEVSFRGWELFSIGGGFIW